MPNPLTILRPAGAEDSPDAEFVRRALEGDRWAEEALFRRHVGDVTRTVLRLLGNGADAEDVVQETFMTALTKLHTLRDPEAVRGWLLQIAVRQVHRIFRKRLLLRALGFGEDGDAELQELAAPSASPEVRAELRRLHRVLTELSPARRIAWVLRYVEGHRIAEVADACGCSEATAKRRIAVADRIIHSRVRFEEGRPDGQAS